MHLQCFAEPVVHDSRSPRSARPAPKAKVRALPAFDLNSLVAAITTENLHAETPTGYAVGNERCAD